MGCFSKWLNHNHLLQLFTEQSDDLKVVVQPKVFSDYGQKFYVVDLGGGEKKYVRISNNINAKKQLNDILSSDVIKNINPLTDPFDKRYMLLGVKDPEKYSGIEDPNERRILMLKDVLSASASKRFGVSEKDLTNQQINLEIISQGVAQGLEQVKLLNNRAVNIRDFQQKLLDNPENGYVTATWNDSIKDLAPKSLAGFKVPYEVYKRFSRLEKGTDFLKGAILVDKSGNEVDEKGEKKGMAGIAKPEAPKPEAPKPEAPKPEDPKKIVPPMGQGWSRQQEEDYKYKKLKVENISALLAILNNYSDEITFDDLPESDDKKFVSEYAELKKHDLKMPKSLQTLKGIAYKELTDLISNLRKMAEERANAGVEDMPPPDIQQNRMQLPPKEKPKEENKPSSSGETPESVANKTAPEPRFMNKNIPEDNIPGSRPWKTAGYTSEAYTVMKSAYNNVPTDKWHRPGRIAAGLESIDQLDPQKKAEIGKKSRDFIRGVYRFGGTWGDNLMRKEYKDFDKLFESNNNFFKKKIHEYGDPIKDYIQQREKITQQLNKGKLLPTIRGDQRATPPFTGAQPITKPTSPFTGAQTGSITAIPEVQPVKPATQPAKPEVQTTKPQTEVPDAPKEPTASQKDVRSRYPKFYGPDWTKWHRLAQIAAGYVEPKDWKERRASDKFMAYLNVFGPNWNTWSYNVKEQLGLLSKEDTKEKEKYDLQDYEKAAFDKSNYTGLLKYADDIKTKYKNDYWLVADAVKNNLKSVVLSNGINLNLRKMQQALINEFGRPDPINWHGMHYRLIPDEWETQNFSVPDEKLKPGTYEVYDDLFKLNYEVPSWLEQASATPNSPTWKTNINQIQGFLIDLYGSDPTKWNRESIIAGGLMKPANDEEAQKVRNYIINIIKNKKQERSKKD